MKRKPSRKTGKATPRPSKKTSPKKKIPLLSRQALISLGVSLFLLLAVLLYVFNPLATPVFDGNRAFQYLEQQYEFGPRFPGSPGHKACGDFLVSELGQFSDRVVENRFNYTDKRDSSIVYDGRNIVASFNLSPKLNYRVMLCAHWDTRQFADKDPDSTLHNQPVPGANDGASGVAVLLEMARILEQFPPDFGVDIILFDLEDAGDYGAAINSDSLMPFCIGANHFANTQTSYRPRYGILLDMIGDKDLKIKKEAYSNYYAPQVVERVWNAARKLNLDVFSDSLSDPIIDDHYPFLEKGIPVIDIIDFDYDYWHTTADTPDKCSPQSLQMIGDVLLEVIYPTE